MKKKFLIICPLLALVLLFALAGCIDLPNFDDFEDILSEGETESCKHKWLDATCTDPCTCEKCGETKGEPWGHTFADATCTAPKTCEECGATEGEKAAHIFKDATCTAPKTCELCGATEGEKAAHSFKDATCTAPKTCKLCGATEGSALAHTYSEEIIEQAECNSAGTKKFTCSLCGDNYTEEFSLSEYEAGELYDMLERSVGEIVTYDRYGDGLALGTGFVYSYDGKIITNYHVIEGACSAEITINGSKYDVEKVLAYSVEKDIAVLKIDARNLGVPRFCSNTHPIASEVYAIGSSRGLTGTFSQGRITYESRVLDGVTYIQHDAAISSGNSGGPLINKYGEVIGINTMTVRDSQSLNFAISVKELDNLSYENSYLLREVYDRERNTFDVLRDGIIDNGDYSADNNQYGMVFGTAELSGYSVDCIRGVFYDVEDDYVCLFVTINADNMVVIEIDEVDGVYDWGYYDSSENYMYGTLEAESFSSRTYLPYTECDPESLANDIRELATDLVNNLCSYMDRDLAAYGLNAEDLGFLNY